MAVLGLSFHHDHERDKRSHERQGSGHVRKLSGVFSSFLDAFRCHVPQAGMCSSSSSNKISKNTQAKPSSSRLNLGQMMRQDKTKDVPLPPAEDKREIVNGHSPSQESAGQVEEKADFAEEDGDEDTSGRRLRLRLRWVVQGLDSGRREEERLRAAMEVRRMCRDSADNRVVLAELGVIPLMVTLLDSISSSSSSLHKSRPPLVALLNLAIGNNRNKQWIVDAGAVPLLVRILSSAAATSDLVDNATATLLSLSALDANKPIIGHSGAIAQLVRIVQDEGGRITLTTRRDSVRVLYNLSISSANVGRLVADGAPDALLRILSSSGGDATDVDHVLVSDRILASLGNLVESSDEARKCIGDPTAIQSLLAALTSFTATLEASATSSSSSSSSSSEEDASSSSSSSASKQLTHCDRPDYGTKTKASEWVCRCQERVLYVLMLLAHHSWAARQAMVSAGAVTPLLEVALLGSAIAQKRAGRILDCLREDRFQQIGRPVSAPLSVTLASSSGRRIGQPRLDLCEERKAVNWMVKQSLERNMEKMVRRARLPSEDLDATARLAISSKLNKSFGSSSSSKTLLLV